MYSINIISILRIEFLTSSTQFGHGSNKVGTTYFVTTSKSMLCSFGLWINEEDL